MEKDYLLNNEKYEKGKAYNALVEKLRSELSDTPPDEGEVFSILDLLLFSLETEQNAYMGNIGLKVSTSILDTLCTIDKRAGRGFLRHIRLFFQAPAVLESLIKRCIELRNSIGMCNTIMDNITKTQLVRFVERGGGTFSTPVIKKWMDSRSMHISPDDWKKLMEPQAS